VFLSYIEGNNTARMSHVCAILDDAEHRTVEIVTSTLTIAEVAFAASEKAAAALDPVTEERIDALWGTSSPVHLVELDPRTAMEARSLVREGMANSRALKPGDAIHLATAKLLGVIALHTYNLEDFARWAGPLGIQITEPESSHPQMIPMPIVPSSSQSPTAGQP
jgi:predicted nucleic acid-binding protein